MSDHLERAEEARERVAGLEYEERWNEDRYTREDYDRDVFRHERQTGQHADEIEEDSE